MNNSNSSKPEKSLSAFFMWANRNLTLLDYNNIHPQRREKLSCCLAAPVCFWWRNSPNLSTNHIRRLSKGQKRHYCWSTLYYYGHLLSICIHRTVDAYIMGKIKKLNALRVMCLGLVIVKHTARQWIRMFFNWLPSMRVLSLCCVHLSNLDR